MSARPSHSRSAGRKERSARKEREIARKEREKEREIGRKERENFWGESEISLDQERSWTILAAVAKRSVFGSENRQNTALYMVRVIKLVGERR